MQPLMAGKIIRVRVPAGVADRDEGNAELDQSTGQQQALIELVIRESPANRLRFQRHVERLLSARRSDHAVSLPAELVECFEQLAVGVGLTKRPIDLLQQLLATVHAVDRQAFGQRDPTNDERLAGARHRVGLEGSVSVAHEPRVPFRLGNRDVRRHVRLAGQFLGRHRAERRIDQRGRRPVAGRDVRLPQRMRTGRVADASHERELDRPRRRTWACARRRSARESWTGSA